ncbi:unnamed protein product [Caenorhabditis auriculariae]|uniref:Uncharacterized protein n=1 Tax=Caenorhabditis auriculariae TaxID=2777116 RepID=A0A8S1HJ15_9PELO|nr:unnamed protein product [Caenorhabditis auriculariae]
MDTPKRPGCTHQKKWIENSQTFLQILMVAEEAADSIAISSTMKKTRRRRKMKLINAVTSSCLPSSKPPINLEELWCPTHQVGTLCPDGTLLSFYKCCGHLNKDCCFSSSALGSDSDHRASLGPGPAAGVVPPPKADLPESPRTSTGPLFHAPANKHGYP